MRGCALIAIKPSLSPSIKNIFPKEAQYSGLIFETRSLVRLTIINNNLRTMNNVIQDQGRSRLVGVNVRLGSVNQCQVTLL